jgi:DNA polymerase III sliding clamp (beta) subunit (PCNA family)
MNIERTTLLKALNSAKPALGSNNQLVELNHFWFDTDYVYAYNEILGIKAPCKTDFMGGVKGDLLLGMLDKSSAKELIIEEDGNELICTAGTAQLTFTLLPFKDFKDIWTIKEPDWDNSYEISDAFIEAVDAVLFSVGNSKVLNPEQRGITIIQRDRGYADLYTTDSATISWARIETDRKIHSENVRCVLLTEFCDLLKGIAKPTDKLSIDQSTASLLVQDGMFVFSRLVEEGETPADFETYMREYTKVEKFVKIPKEFDMALARAELLTTKGTSEVTPVEFSIKEREPPVLTLYAKTLYGEIDDEIEIEPGHEKIVVKADVSLVKRALNKRTGFAIKKECIVLTGPVNFFHIIAPN